MKAMGLPACSNNNAWMLFAQKPWTWKLCDWCYGTAWFFTASGTLVCVWSIQKNVLKCWIRTGVGERSSQVQFTKAFLTVPSSKKMSSIMQMGVNYLSPNCYENECMWTTQKARVSRIHVALSQLVQLCLPLLWGKATRIMRQGVDWLTRRPNNPRAASQQGFHPPCP